MKKDSRKRVLENMRNVAWVDANQALRCLLYTYAANLEEDKIVRLSNIINEFKEAIEDEIRPKEKR